MDGNGLAALGSGISQAYFGGLAQQRQEEQAKKDKDLAMQLAAYHALMEHDETPVGSIPEILDAQGKLLKAPKEFYAITQHMRDSIRQRGQVPSGPEQSHQVTPPQIHFQLPTQGEDAPLPAPRTPTAVQADPSYFLRAQGPGAVSTVPAEPGTEPPPQDQIVRPRSGAESGLYDDVLAQVPREPTTVTYQPAKAYGEMSQGEAADFRKSQQSITQQRAILDRQSQLAEDAGDRASQRDADRAKAALDLQEKKNAGRVAVVEQTFAEKKKALGAYDSAAAAAADKQRLALELQLRAGGMDPTEAKERSGTVLAANMDAVLDQHKAKAQRDRAEIQHWTNIDSGRLVGKGGAATQGMSAEQARTFRANITEVLPELNAVRGQLESLKTLQAQMGTTADPAIQARIDGLEQRHTALLLQVKSERDKVMAARQNVSRVPGAPGGSAAPSPSGTFDMKGWAQSHPNATEAEKAAIRSKAKARNLTVSE